jgi:hypothetical protein
MSGEPSFSGLRTASTNHRFELRFAAGLPFGKTRYFWEDDCAIANKNPYSE